MGVPPVRHAWTSRLGWEFPLLKSMCWSCSTHASHICFMLHFIWKMSSNSVLKLHTLKSEFERRHQQWPLLFCGTIIKAFKEPPKKKKPSNFVDLLLTQRWFSSQKKIFETFFFRLWYSLLSKTVASSDSEFLFILDHTLGYLGLFLRGPKF